MPKGLKLERNYMDKKIISQKVGELRQETEELEELSEKYMLDESTFQRLIASIEASDLPPSEKQEQLQSLRESQRILYMHYKKEVQDEMDRVNKESEDLIEKVEDTTNEVKEKTEEMEKARIETGTVSLDKNIDKQNEFYELLEKTKTEEAKELVERQRFAEITRRHMERNKGKIL